MWSMPVCDSASISSILRAVGIGALLELKTFARAFLADVHGGSANRSCRGPDSRGRDSRTCSTQARRSRRPQARARPRISGGVFADRRRLAAQRQIVIADLDRQARQLGARAAGKIDVEHAAAGVELRIVEQVARFGDRRERNIDTIEQFGKRRQACAARRSRRPSAAAPDARARGPRWSCRPDCAEGRAGRNARRSGAIAGRW